MKHFIITQQEFKHFIRSPFKTISLFLFVGAAIYGLQNGYELLKTQQDEIAAINIKNNETIAEVVGWYDAGKKGPDDKPWIDVTTPMRAIWYTPALAAKEPSPLMPFSIGQAEQFGFYKQVSNWSSVLDSDSSGEISNPERLTVGTLDFGFVVLYLLPILVIVLVFNIGGLEKDFRFDQLIQTNIASRQKWLLARSLFYFVLIAVILLLLVIVYAAATGALSLDFLAVLKLYFYVMLYTLLWFVAFYLVNFFGNRPTRKTGGSANQALKMISLWLLFCVIIPGAVHQLASLKYPTNYMVDFVDAKREETNKIWDLPAEDIRNQLVKLYPKLALTKHAKDSIADSRIMGSSSSGLVNRLMKNTILTIENSNENKNQWIRNTYLINPVSFFQNKLSAIASTDYYAYKDYRAQIQSMIDKKITLLLFDNWNKKTIDKKRFIEYTEQFKQ